MPRAQTTHQARSPAVTQCKYCHQRVSRNGGGLSNHFWRSKSCRNVCQKEATASNEVNSSGQNDEGNRNSPLQHSINGEDNDAAVDDGHHAADGDDDRAGGEPENRTRYKVVPDARAAFIYPERTSTPWENMKASEDPNAPHAPWANKEEYQLVNWLATSHISQGAIDKFLKLGYVRVVLLHVICFNED